MSTITQRFVDTVEDREVPVKEETLDHLTPAEKQKRSLQQELARQESQESQCTSSSMEEDSDFSSVEGDSEAEVCPDSVEMGQPIQLKKMDIESDSDGWSEEDRGTPEDLVPRRSAAVSFAEVPKESDAENTDEETGEEMDEDQSKPDTKRRWIGTPAPVRSTEIDNAARRSRRISIHERCDIFIKQGEADLNPQLSVPKPLDCAVDLKEKLNSLAEAASQEHTPSRVQIEAKGDVRDKKAFWHSASESEKAVVTSVPRPLDCAVDLKEKMSSFTEAAQSGFMPVKTESESMVKADVEGMKIFWKTASEVVTVVTSVPRPLDCSVDLKEKINSFTEVAQNDSAVVKENDSIANKGEVERKKSFWHSASESEKAVVTSVPRPLDCAVDLKEKMSSFTEATQLEYSPTRTSEDIDSDVKGKKCFWRSASENSRVTTTSVPRPLDTPVDIMEKIINFTEAVFTESQPARSTVDIEFAPDMEEKKAFWHSTSESEKAVVTSVPRPLDCTVDLKEKMSSFTEAAQTGYTPVRIESEHQVKADVEGMKSFWHSASENEKAVVTSVPRPLDCTVDLKEKMSSFTEAAQSEYVPNRPAAESHADVEGKKAFWRSASESEKAVMTSMPRPLDCAVDLKEKMSSFTEAAQAVHTPSRVEIQPENHTDVASKKSFWRTASESSKAAQTSIPRPLDCPVDLKEKMHAYTEAVKSPEPKSSISSQSGRCSIRIKTTAESCDICNKALYITEKIVADKKNYHRSCFKCAYCSAILKLGNYAGLDGKFYCRPHFKQLFQTKGNYNEAFGSDKLTKKWTSRNVEVTA